MKIGDIVRITDPEEYYDKLYNLLENMENINAQIGDRIKLCGSLDGFNLDGLEATIVENGSPSIYRWTVKFDKEYVGYTHEGYKGSNEKLYFHIRNQNIAYIINNKKDMTEEEKVIKEGEMAMKMYYNTSSMTNVGDVKSTLSSLKKRSKRVGFSSIPLKSTI